MYSTTHILALVGLITILAAVKQPFDGYHIWLQKVETLKQSKALENIENATEHFVLLNPAMGEANYKVHMAVPPDKRVDFVEFSKKYKFNSQLVPEDFQKLLDNENQASVPFPGFGWSGFYQLENLNEWMENVTRKFPNSTEFLQFETTNLTFSGMKISFKADNPAIFVEAEVLNRDYSTAEGLAWIIDKLLTSKDPWFRNIAENIDWYFVPAVNITEDEDGGCTNGNYMPCIIKRSRFKVWSDEFVIFQLAKRQSIAEVLQTIDRNVTLFLSFRSVKDSVMDFDDQAVANDDRHVKLVTKHLEEASDVFFRFGVPRQFQCSICDTTDFVTLYSYVYETRSEGQHGFLLSPDRIGSNFHKILVSLVYLIQDIRSQGLLLRNGLHKSQ